MRYSINAHPLLIPRVRCVQFCLGFSAVVLLAILAAACSSGEGSGEATFPPTGKVRVVATTGILGDIVSTIGGVAVEVRTLVPPGADVHSFQSTPADSVAISRAMVVVSNGRGLDDFLGPLIESAMGSDAVHVVASEGLQLSWSSPVRSGDGIIVSGGHLHEDPHLWQNPLYVIHYVERIRTALIQADPGQAETFDANAADYIQKLRALDQEISGALRSVPQDRRRLVTFHDAFGHFAQRYGWNSSALAPHDGSEVTPGKIVSALKEIKGEGLPVVFVEPQFRSGIMDQAANDAGISVGIFYSDALDSTVPTYVDMMKFNVDNLVSNLR